jgi:hypothetical protein
MVIKKQTSEVIKRIIEKYHRYLLVTMVGKKNVPPIILTQLEAAGLKPNEDHSFLDIAYHHNWINAQDTSGKPKSLKEMKAQQKGDVLPEGQANQASLEYLNSNFQNLIDKQRSEVMSKISALIQEENNAYKFNALQNLNRPTDFDEAVKTQSKSKLKQALRDATNDAAMNWDRIVATEMSNAVSLGSVDRVVSENRDTPSDEVYVYRIVKNDAALCKECRRFYLDSDGTPKLYRLSTLLNNGSNFGKRRTDWSPVAVATHPNERCSQVIQLNRGYYLTSGGSQTFRGLDGWDEYVEKKLQG